MAGLGRQGTFMGGFKYLLLFVFFSFSFCLRMYLSTTASLKEALSEEPLFSAHPPTLLFFSQHHHPGHHDLPRLNCLAVL